MATLTYTDSQIIFIRTRKDAGDSWDIISQKFNKEFNDDKTANAIRKTYYRFEDYEFSDEEMLTNIRKAHSATKLKSIISKENKSLLDYIEGKEALIEEIEGIIKTAKFTKPKVIKLKRDKKKRNMTMEVMLTDLHYGKKSKTFNFSN